MIFLFPFVLFFNDLSYSQSSGNSLDTFLDSVDNLYGTNDMLVNGYPYRVPNDHILGHPYYLGDKWMEATLHISGNCFDNQQVKYNVVDNVLILKADVKGGSKLLVRTNRLLIDSFRIEDQLFVNASLILDKDTDPGFYQVIYNGEVQFIRKFSKQFIRDYGGTSPQGRFSSTDEERFLIRGDEMQHVNSRWSFIRSFPKAKRKAIRRYLRRHSVRYSRADFEELVDLSKFCFN